MPSDARARGAYYTRLNIARYLAGWAIRKTTDTVLEPSFGSGAFIDAALERLAELGGSAQNLFAVEVHQETYQNCLTNLDIDSRNFINANFLTVDRFPVDAVIGNPPYVRLRHLDRTSAQLAIARSESAGVKMTPDGSLWMPFVVHACSFIKPGGRLALVLPFEMTHVKYAIPLWEFLSRSFGHLTIIRTDEDLFPGNEEETLLLLADNYTGSTSSVQYRIYLSHNDLLNEVIPYRQSEIPLENIFKRQKPFIKALLEPDLQHLINHLARNGSTTPLQQICRFKIGFVTGDKTFFHPDLEIRKQYQLPPANFINAVKNARQLRGKGLYLNQLDFETCLYYPVDITAGDHNYIKFGEKAGINNRYKCRVRNPWYLTPGIEIPDVLLTVFSETPILTLNSAGFAASNSLLCGFIKDTAISPEELACRWYNSLVLLLIELNIHSLGGGVLVLIPGEVNNLLLPARSPDTGRQAFLREVDFCLKQQRPDQAYRAGDNFLLRVCLALSTAQIDLIRNGIATLQHWRRPYDKKGCRE